MRPAPIAAVLFLALGISVRAVAQTAAGHPAPAVTQPTPGQLQAARDLFKDAQADEGAEHWADALAKFRRVGDVKLTAGVRYHVALCEEKLGQTATALEHYTEARDAAKDEHNKDVLGLLADPFLADLRARVPSLTVDVPGDVAGVTVTLDDHPHPQGLWGIAVPVDPGAHRVDARADGRAPFHADLTLKEREVTVLDVTLPVVVAAPLPPPIPAPVASTPPPAPSPAAATPAAPPEHRRSLVAPVLTTIGAAVLVGGGVAAYFVADADASSGRSECLTRTNCDDLKTPVRTWDAVALGAWIGGGLLAATSVVLWALPQKDSSASSARLSAGPGVVRLEGSF